MLFFGVFAATLGVFFWPVLVVLLLIESVVLFRWTATERPFRGLFSVLLFLALLHTCGYVDIMSLPTAHKFWFWLAVGCYVPLSVLYMIGRFWYEVKRLSWRGEDARADWLQAEGSKRGIDVHGMAIPPKDLLPDYRAWAKTQYGNFGHARVGLYDIPRSGDHKALIASWGMYWPISLIWTILGDFVVEMYEMIIRKLAAKLDAIAARSFRAVRQGLEA